MKVVKMIMKIITPRAIPRMRPREDSSSDRVFSAAPITGKLI